MGPASASSSSPASAAESTCERSAARACSAAWRRPTSKPASDSKQRSQPQRDWPCRVKAPAQPVAKRCARREWPRMTPTGEPCTAGGTAVAELGAALEERHVGALAREVECTADAERAAADDEYVRTRHGTPQTG